MMATRPAVGRVPMHADGGEGGAGVSRGRFPITCLSPPAFTVALGAPRPSSRSKTL